MRKHKNSRRYTESKANARCLLKSKNKRYARVCVRGGLLERERKKREKKRERKTQCDIFRVSHILGFRVLKKSLSFVFLLSFLSSEKTLHKSDAERRTHAKNTTTFTTTTTLFFLLSPQSVEKKKKKKKKKKKNRALENVV